jgi:predicted permease
LETKADRPNVILASLIKLVLMPVVAWASATYLLLLDPQAVYAVTVLAALPAAQNVLNYASEYGTNTLLARDVIFLTTFGTIPAILVVTLFLAR